MTIKASEAQVLINLRASLFGTLMLEQEGRYLSLPTSSNVRAPLAYLLIRPSQTHSRAVLAGQLWPNVPEPRSRHSLRQALWHINQSLPGLLQADANTVGISPHIHLRTDVSEFNELLRPLLIGTETDTHSQTRSNLHQAIQLYQGDLLEEFYEDWILAEREQLYKLYLQALERTIELEKLAGRYQQALAIAQKLVEAEPLRESTHREIMKLNYLLSRTDAALKQYSTCRQSLAAEMDAPPEPETIRLAREIAARSDHATPTRLPPASQRMTFLGTPSTVSLPLIGRRNERSSLIEQVEKTCRGGLGLILVEGEAGIGKTRLLQEVAQDAEWRGIEVLWGKSNELEATTPYGPLLEALNSGLSPLRASQITSLLRDNLPDTKIRQNTQNGESESSTSHERQIGKTIWLQVLCALMPALAANLPDTQTSRPASLEPSQEHLRLAEALSRLLIIWSQITPLMLILEDLHWADRDTLDTLIHLTDQLPAWLEYTTAGLTRPLSTDGSSGGFLIIGSYRGEAARSQSEVWERIQSLDCLSLQERLILQRLDTTATSELIKCSLEASQHAPLFEAHLHKETNGNPLFILETLRYLYEEGLLWRDENTGYWHTPFDEDTTDHAELPLSPVIEHIIGRRLARLPSRNQLALNTAAVLGSHFGFSLLAATTDMDTAEIVAALGDLVQQGFIDEQAQEYHFHHDKTRLVVYNNLTTEERISLHRQAAQAIEDAQPTQVEVLAYHCTLGHLWDKAVHYHQLAAEVARSAHTCAAAAEHLSTALELLDKAQEEQKRYQLLAAHEAMLGVLGEREAQAADLKTMLELAHTDNLRQAHTLCRQVELLVQLSRFDEAEATAQQALTMAENSNSKSAQAAALIALGHAYSVQHRPKQAIPYLRQAVEICQEQNDLPQEARAHHSLAIPLSECQISDAQPEIQAALAIYEELGDQHGQAKAMGTLGILSMEQGDNEAAISYHSKALQIARQIGYRSEEARSLHNLGHIFWNENRFAQALQYFSQVQLIYRALGDVRLEFYAHESIATIRCFILGDVDTAWNDLQAAVAYCRQKGDSLHYGLDTLGEIACCRGDFKTARAYLEQSITNSLNAGMAWLSIQLHISFIQLELGEDHPATALKHLEVAETLCQETGISGWSTKLLELRGLVMLAMGRTRAALKATSQAMDQLRPGTERAYLVPFRHFQVLTALGREQEASAALEQAYQMLSEALSGFTPEQQNMSWERVPEHRSIRAARKTPSLITIRLPRANAPTGRSLYNDEYVEVHWTIAKPEDNTISSKTARRHKRILRLLHQAEKQGAAPTLNDLASALNVGRTTIKRDLAALRQSNHSISTRGSRKNDGHSQTDT